MIHTQAADAPGHGRRGLQPRRAGDGLSRPPEGGAMKKNALRLPLLVLALVAAASTLALHASARSRERQQSARSRLHRDQCLDYEPHRRPRRLPAHQHRKRYARGVRSRDDGPRPTQDRSVHPCGPGSWTNAGIQRITVAAGVLVIREPAYVCPTASGPMGSGTWTVDGPSRTSLFAGARGSGEGTADITAHTSTLSGKLHLASADDD